MAQRGAAGVQTGARWNYLGRGYEVSLAFYEGHNHLPQVDGRLIPGRGRGGSVVLIGNPQMGTLLDLRHRKAMRAEHGRAGQSARSSTG